MLALGPCRAFARAPRGSPRNRIPAHTRPASLSSVQLPALPGAIFASLLGHLEMLDRTPAIPPWASEPNPEVLTAQGLTSANPPPTGGKKDSVQRVLLVPSWSGRPRGRRRRSLRWRGSGPPPAAILVFDDMGGRTRRGKRAKDRHAKHFSHPGLVSGRHHVVVVVPDASQFGDPLHAAARPSLVFACRLSQPLGRLFAQTRGRQRCRRQHPARTHSLQSARLAGCLRRSLPSHSSR